MAAVAGPALHAGTSITRPVGRHVHAVTYANGALFILIRHSGIRHSSSGLNSQLNHVHPYPYEVMALSLAFSDDFYRAWVLTDTYRLMSVFQSPETSTPHDQGRDCFALTLEDNAYRSRTHGMMHPRTGAHSIFDTQRQQDTAVSCSC